MKKWIQFLVALGVLLLLCAVAFAQDEPPAENEEELNTAQQILTWVAAVAVAAFGTVATWLLTKGAKYLQAKTGVEFVSDAQIKEWAELAKGLAREKSHQAIQEHGKKLTGPQQYEIAVQFGLDRLREHGLDEKAKQKFDDYLHAVLGMERTVSLEPAPPGAFR